MIIVSIVLHSSAWGTRSGGAAPRRRREARRWGTTATSGSENADFNELQWWFNGGLMVINSGLMVIDSGLMVINSGLMVIQ